MTRVLCHTRVILITHIHGDHAFGIYKMLLERDRALLDLADGESTPVYCVLPILMIHSVEYFIAKNIKLPHLIKLIPSSDCNPEGRLWYAHHHTVDPSVPYCERQSNSEDSCPRQDVAEVRAKVTSFSSPNPLVHEM